MNITDPKIVSLRESVKAAQEELTLAVAFHETWKPTSYAANTFNVVHAALRREMVLALMRLWDKPAASVRLEHIGQTLRDKQVVDALANDRAPFPEAMDQMRHDLELRAGEAIALISKYSRGGSHYNARDALQRMRHERLAHRKVTTVTTTSATATDNEIESLYYDTSEIVRLLLSVVNAVAHDPAGTGEVFRHYAAHFWASVRGERTEGHPSYRAPVTAIVSPKL